MIDYKILSTGSKGNAVIINSYILVDCGVPFRMLCGAVDSLRIALFTHRHSDHINIKTVSRLNSERPALRFACAPWMIRELEAAGVPKKNIDTVNVGGMLCYGNGLKISPVELKHNVPNCGWRIFLPSGEKIFYATDTCDLNGIEAKGYALYMVEANYEEHEIEKRIADKKLDGEYAYEQDVLKNHMSLEDCNNWLYQNMNSKSQYVYLHQHEER